MRINLRDGGQAHKARQKGGRSSRRRTRTFDRSIALPQVPARSLDQSRRTRKPDAEAQPRQQPERQRTATRQRQAREQRRAREAKATALAPTAGGVRWRSLSAQVPIVLLLVALIGGIAYASADARFFVYDAQVVGARHLAAETIYQAAGVHEQNIFWVRPQDVVGRITKMKGIKAVRVSCSLPAQVVIEVEEREPVLMWRAEAQGQDFWLDEEGYILPYHGDVHSADTIFVVDSSDSHLEVGGFIEPEGIVQSVKQLAAALPDIEVFSYDGDRGLSFVHQVSGGEWPVYVGSSEDLTYKIQVVQVLSDYLQANNIQPRYVDVRWPDHPVFGRPPAE